MEGMRPQGGWEGEEMARSRSGTRRNGGVGGKGGKAAACYKKVGGSLRWAKKTWVTTVGGAWVAGSARWKAAFHGAVSQGDCMMPLVQQRCEVSNKRADMFDDASMH